MRSVIKFENVWFQYGPNVIIQGGSFDIKEGEFIGIIGPNGGGKTTLLKLIMGILKPQKGKIAIFEDKDRCPIGYTPQSLGYERDFPISLFELVLMGCAHKINWLGLYPKSEKERSKKMIEKVGLAHLQKKAIAELSQGQFQRALFARSLVSDPPILMLDEPTASVDVEAENKIFAELASLKGTKTIIMVSHNLNFLAANADRLLLVEKTVSSLRPENICQHFALGLFHNPLIRK